MDDILKSWVTLNAGIMNLSESACAELIITELDTLNRRSMLRRLHGRLNTLRARRERVGLGIAKVGDK